MKQREIVEELMDRADQDPGDLVGSLDDLRVVNRWLGGRRSAIRQLGPMIERVAGGGARPVRLLDIGTGSADLPLQLVGWSRRRGIALEVIATDLHPVTSEVARSRTASEPAILVMRADALALPFANDSFDLALCSTALHHFHHDSAVAVLRELNRVTTAGFVVSDLRRTRAALWGARALAATVWRRHPITRHDGPSSVAAAFTVGELRELMRDAGMPEARVAPEPLFRVAAVIDRTQQRNR